MITVTRDLSSFASQDDAVRITMPRACAVSRWRIANRPTTR